jgi:hypothetical protein
VTDELRALLRAEMDAQQPPPIGDVVGAAVRDGQRHRRRRRLGRVGLGAAVAGAVALVAVLVAEGGFAARPDAAVPAAAPEVVGDSTPAEALSPETVPIEPNAPTALPQARTLAIHSGTQRAEGMQKKATSAAMLHLLTQLLPPGRTTHHGVAPDDDLHVQLYLDDGAGPGMVRVAVDTAAPAARTAPKERLAADGSVLVTVRHFPDNCAQSTVVDAERPDGTLVQLDVSSCRRQDGRPTAPALTADEAIAVVTDPRWGVTMDAALVDDGGRIYRDVPVFAR